MNKAHQKILITGLGLMGASLALALRKHYPRVRLAALSRNTKALAMARKKGWIDEGSPRIEDLIEGVTLAVLCTPVDVEASQLELLDRAAQGPILVTDVGSVKGELEAFIKKRRFKHLTVVPAHPMVGSHEQGASAARSGLYEGGLAFVIRRKGIPAAALKDVCLFWSSLQMRVSVMDARRHDAIVAQISHLPHAAAACLMHAVDTAVLPFAASGFRDTTRVAAAHPSVWEPIFMANAGPVDKALASFEKEIRIIRKMIRSKDSKALRRRLMFSSRRRQEI